MSLILYLRKRFLDAISYLIRPVYHRILPDPYLPGGKERLKEKPAFQSRITMTELILPSHADTRGFVYAGFILGWIDIAAGIAARRHATYPCVTRSVDDVHFLHPIKVGDLVMIQATVNKAWKTSMEVGVRVETESPLSGHRRFVAHAYLTFVALNPKPTAYTMLGRALQEHRPVIVPQVVPTTPLERQRYDAAEQRRQQRFDQGAQGERLNRVRELMRQWSQGLKLRVTSDAEVVRHEILMTEPDLGEEGEEVGSPDEKDRVPLRHRFSIAQSNSDRPYQRPMEESFAEMVELVLPQHANTLQITFGGQIMQWMESCSIASASRHGRTYLLTASIDSLSFVKPTRVGDVVTVRSIVSRAFRSSIEVYVSVEAENLVTGEVYYTNDGYFTIVAVDLDNFPTTVPRAIPHTAEEISLHQGGEARRARRLEQRRELVLREGYQAGGGREENRRVAEQPSRGEEVGKVEGRRDVVVNVNEEITGYFE